MAAYSNSSRALAFITERAEDLASNIRGLVDGAGSAKFLDTSEDKVALIRQQLESNRDEQKLEALKRLIAMISKNRDVSSFFASVIKNVASPSLEIRKLVYIYLLRYSSAEPDLALLSINTFQRDLTDPNPLIRAMALRVLSGIRVPVIAGIVVMSVGKAAKDVSPYVRKTAALAIPKCYDLDEELLPQLVPILSALLADRSAQTLGATLVAFARVCPDRFDLLHKHYRKLCAALIDMDEWGQAQVLGVLARYARTQFADPDRPKEKQKSEGTRGEEEDEELPGFEKQAEELTLDPDHELLLKSAEPLLQSRNPTVAMAAIKLFFYVAPRSRLSRTISRPLVRLAHFPPDIQYIVLLDTEVVARERPELLSSYLSTYFVRATDPLYVKRAKLRILVYLAQKDNVGVLLRELLEYVRFPSDEFASLAIQAIGQVASSQPEVSGKCLSALMKLLKTKNDALVSQSVMVVKTLIQLRESPSSDVSTASSGTSQPTGAIIARLARMLYATLSSSSSKIKKNKKASKTKISNGGVSSPDARACIFWLLGQYAHLTVQVRRRTAASEATAVQGGGGKEERTLAEVVAPDVLRLAAKSFSAEASSAKLQILTLATKLFILSPSSRPVSLLLTYVLQLARYDLNYDVRDRARFCKGLVSGIGQSTGTFIFSVAAASALSGVEEGVEVEGMAGKEELEREEREAVERGGVRLRREQVQMVMFGGKESPKTGWQGLDGHLLGSLALALDGRSLKREEESNPLPPWAEPDAIPDPSTRHVDEPPPSSVPTAFARSVSSPSLRSLSSEQFFASGGAAGVGRAREPVILVPTETGSGRASPAGVKVGRGQGGWKDLDEFLDESSESEEEETERLSGAEEEEDEEEGGSDEEEEEEEEEEDEEEDESEEEDSGEDSEGDSEDEKEEGGEVEDAGRTWA